jgi:cell division protein FtsQ
MRRAKTPRYRGSVQQNTVRVRPKESSWTGVLFRLAALLGSVLILLLLGIWLWHIGWPQREAGRVADAGIHLTQKAQFAVKDIVVEGRQQTSRDSIYAALGANAGAPIFTFDPHAAQQRLAKLPWVQSATVERILPNKILIRLVERMPMARWQHEGKTVVIDDQGKELEEAHPDQYGNLPLVVGFDAPPETKKLLDNLKNHPTVQKATTAAVRVAERRWDLHLDPNVVAKLPEVDVDDALDRLSKLIEDKKILDRNVTAIDLRFSDRLIIEPAAAAPATAPKGATKL